MDILLPVNKQIEDIREYKVASHEIWTAQPTNREKYLKLDWNEATIDPSPHVNEKILECINEGHFYYLYPETKNEKLINLISEYVELPEDYIQYFPSSDSIAEYACRVFLNDHSRVLLLSPTYDNFRLTAESTGAEIIYSDMPNNFVFSEKLFEQDIQNYQPDFVYICNPNNPTGTQLSKEYIRHLISTYPRTFFIVDEAYWEFSRVTSTDLVKDYNNLLITRTFSKAFALANFRIGYIISNPLIIAALNKIRNPKNITTLSQIAAIAALEDEDYTIRYVKDVISARENFFTFLKKYKNIGEVVESHANFILLHCKSLDIKIKLYEYLKSCMIYVREVTQRPSLLKCLRISIGTQQQMSIVEAVIDQFIVQNGLGGTC